ncbi:MAG: hypothetical protein M0Z94_13675 [Dehalococcoidales bacterium]|nr:hypothetical protein [Dehalococcoidales bacterium]
METEVYRTRLASASMVARTMGVATSEIRGPECIVTDRRLLLSRADDGTVAEVLLRDLDEVKVKRLFDLPSIFTGSDYWVELCFANGAGDGGPRSIVALHPQGRPNKDQATELASRIRLALEATLQEATLQ